MMMLMKEGVLDVVIVGAALNRGGCVELLFSD